MTETEMLARYEPLVRSIAARWSGAVSFEDLAQEGRLGLIDAWRTYDASRGKLPNWIYHRSRSRIRHYIRDRGPLIALPAWAQEWRVRDRLPGDEVRGEGENELRRLKPLELIPLHGDRRENAFQEGWTGSLEERIPAPSHPGGYPCGLTFEELIEDLTEVEREALRLRFRDQWVIADISRRLGVCPTTGQRLIESALQKLRREYGCPSPSTGRPATRRSSCG